ncbi:hypothetical protein [Amycolatopsis magusensis]
MDRDFDHVLHTITLLAGALTPEQREKAVNAARELERSLILAAA